MTENAETAAKTEAPGTEKGLSIQRNSKLVPRDLGEARDICSLLAKADALPREFLGKPANILLAVMHGAEVGMSPAQSLSSIMVLNGRASIFGDSLMGIVKASSVYEGSKDEYDPKLEGGTAIFKIKRRGEDWVTRTFSMEDAKRAGLVGKSGPWTTYPKRMLFMRARAWAIRDVFPDVTKGIRVAEEEQDIIETTITAQAQDVSPAAEAREIVKEAEVVSQPQKHPEPRQEASPAKAAEPAQEPAKESPKPAKKKGKLF